MEDLQPYKAYLEAHLSPRRLTHSYNVAAACRMLADRYGGVDTEKAYFAGLVHDIAKDLPKDEQYCLMMQSDMQVCQEEREAYKVWHAIAGAELLRRDFHVTDMDVLRAVRYHTIGRAGMSQLEKIVYLGDMISVERDFPDVDVLRERAKVSLESGICYALDYSMRKLMSRNSPIPCSTVEAYNEMVRIVYPHSQPEG